MLFAAAVVGKGAPFVAVWSALATHWRGRVLEHPSLAPARAG
jgi:hypothetical protein